MKQIADVLHARLSDDVLSLCLCWRLIRADAQIFGLTNHDQMLDVDGVIYHPGASLDSERFVQGADLQPGRISASGALSSALILDADLHAGLWDNCKVDIYRVDWQVPHLGGLHFWSGYLSTITVSERGGFEAELVSKLVDLQRPIGRIVQRRCDAVLGDERCGAAVNGRACDQRFETCRDVFANTENFRGFPHLPGTDFILSGPAATGNDGGRR